MVKRTASRPDLVEQVAQRDEGAGALGHAHRLAAAQDMHDLAQHDFAGAPGSDSAFTAAFMRWT